MKNKMMAVLNVENDKKIGIVAFDQKEDTVLFCWIVNNKAETLRRSFLKCDKNGNMYFTSYRKRYYINEFKKA